jgi:hypothetical protein
VSTAPAAVELPAMTATLPDVLPIAVRAHTVTRKKPKKETQPRHPSDKRRRVTAVQPRYELVFDTETTTDTTQALKFGCWRYYRINRTKRTCVQEGLFYADDLPDRDPRGFAELSKYATTRHAATSTPTKQPLAFISRTVFVERVFFRAGYDNSTRIIGFNLPFDISRIAIDVTEGRDRGRGAFSFILAAGNAAKGFKERRHRPRVTVKHVDRNRAFIRFTAPLEAVDRWDGDFVDVKTLVFALTGRGHSLQSACRAFGLGGKADPGGHGVITAQYIDYCRQDVTATADLYAAALQDLDRWNINLPPGKASSPASIGKALLDAMGLVPALERQPDLSPALLGHAMSAFFGGRAECHIRKTPVPIRLVDFTSTYTTIAALLKLWPYMTAEQLDTTDVTEELRDLLSRITLDDCFDPKLWPRLVGIALVQPDGDILPVRAEYDPARPGYGIGVNPLTSTEPLWYTFPDLVASTLLTGKAPTIVRAERLIAVGQLPDLTPVTLPGGQIVDPRTDDPFTAMIEHRIRVRRDPTINPEVRERIQKGLKFTASATAYGINAEYNPQELAAGDTRLVDVHGRYDDPFTDRTPRPEEPGKYCCPPIAAVITGAARLLLALLERCVTDLGGTWAFADTDSMAIVARARGGLVPCQGGPLRNRAGQPCVRALRYAQVEAIRERFTPLNPYDPAAVPDSILENQLDQTAGQTWCWAIAAKRYALYRTGAEGRPRLVPDSEHDPCSFGLGHLLNPTDPDSDDRAWIRQSWEHILAQHLTDKPPKSPDWFNRPALGRITVTNPRLLSALSRFNQDKAYSDRIKPFNFLLFAPSAQPMAGGSKQERFRLIAPYESDARQWLRLPWQDQYHPGHPQRVSSDPAQAATATLRTYSVVIELYAAHPEPKSVGSDGLPCHRATLGLLRRRPATAGSTVHIGKEANRIDERGTGETTTADFDVTSIIYQDPRSDAWAGTVLPRLRQMEMSALAAAVDVSYRRLQDILKERATPRPRLRAALTAKASP